MEQKLSSVAKMLTSSPIQRLSHLAQRCNAVNLAEGFPDFPAPTCLKDAAISAIRSDLNQYRHVQAICDYLAYQLKQMHGLDVDPLTDIVVCCGQSEAFAAAIFAIINQGDEVILFDPSYETYETCIRLAGGVPVYVALDPPHWSLDSNKLAKSFTGRTKAIVLNSPHNPTGKVFTKDELEIIAGACRTWDILVVTDEVYEHITFDGERHTSVATFPGMQKRTIITSSLSKSFSVTGWRIGWAICPACFASAIRNIHVKITDSAPAPFQEAALTALRSSPEYFDVLRQDYKSKRDYLAQVLTKIGFQVSVKPKGSFFLFMELPRTCTLSDLMILVDDAGKAFPSINHSPWFGVTLADFVMPFFLFIVGVSSSLVFKKVSSKPQATKKVLLRTVKLFILGLFLQGGYFHGRDNLSYGVDIAKIRWMGVLQRISIGYLFASILEIWCANDYPVDSSKAFIRRYFFQVVAGILIGLSYLILLYGLYVPDWFFEISSLNMESPVSGYGLSTQTVNCGVRGSLEPPCNVVGLIDRLLLGEKHLYQRPVYRRTKECSVKSPDYGPLPSNAPGWCLAPFDPEGILSSLMAAITCLVGLHFGHILVHVKDHMQRVIFWSVFSVFLTLAGYVLEFAGVPLSKPLYTLSYMFITAGVSGLLLVVLYYIVDVKCYQKPMKLFQWMGMNALILYALAACDLLPGALQGFYWYSPENNLVDITERFIQSAFNSKKWGTLVFVMLEILFWGLVAGLLHAKKVYIKL